MARRLSRAAFLSVGLAIVVCQMGLLSVDTGPYAGPSRDDEIQSVRAFLYYQSRGEFDSQDLLSGSVPLRNIIIGGGGAEAPAGAMLVLVTVRVGELSAKARSKSSVRLTVTDKEGTLSEQRVSLETLFSEESVITVPFLVYRTGCERVNLAALLERDAKAIASRNASAEFTCGE